MVTSELCEKVKAVFSGLKIQVENENDYLPSAVLLPLVHDKDGLSLLFEVRSPQLAWQPGEVCFPGGRIEAADASPRDTALRETSEELRLSPKHIDIFGPTDYIINPLGVVLHPYVGYIDDLSLIHPNPDEVAEIFTVPLRFLFQAEPQVGHMQMATQPKADFPFDLVPPTYPKGWNRRIVYPVYFYSYQDHVIWGLTGRVLKGFIDRCRTFGIIKETAAKA